MRPTFLSIIVVFVFVGAVTTSAFTPNTPIVKQRTNNVAALKSMPFDSGMISTLVSLDITQAQQPLIAGAVALLGLVGVVVSNGNKSDDTTSASSAAPKTSAAATPEPKVDISIPYNAAAMLEYTKLMGKFDATAFTKFESLYTEKVVAQVTAKKVERDCKMEMDKLNAIVSKVDAEIAALASSK